MRTGDQLATSSLGELTAERAPLPLRSRAGKSLSLVIPMHDEATGLSGLFERLDTACEAFGLGVEILCVDDGSRDETLALLRGRAAEDSRIKIVALSRNFGKEAALTAGLELAAGDLVVPLDADLQDPPELIGTFLTLWEQGFDVVYGIRTDRASDTPLKRWTANNFYRLFNLVADHPIPANTGDFRLMDRAVVEVLKKLPERNRFMKGLFAWVGFRQVGVPYARPARASGATSWGYLKLSRFAIDGLTSFSTAPLRVWTFVGVTAAVAALAYAGFIMVRVMVIGRDIPGYASIMVVVLLGFAVQMIALGVMGEYIGRMYQEVKGRPIYTVRELIGFRA